MRPYFKMKKHNLHNKNENLGLGAAFNVALKMIPMAGKMMI